MTDETGRPLTLSENIRAALIHEIGAALEHAGEASAAVKAICAADAYRRVQGRLADWNHRRYFDNEPDDEEKATALFDADQQVAKALNFDE